MPGLGQLQQRFDRGRGVCARRQCTDCTRSGLAVADHQPIASESLHARLLNSPGIDSRLHLPFVGGGEDVGPRPLAQLTGQMLGTGKVENNVTSMTAMAERQGRLLEDIGEGCGCEDRDYRCFGCWRPVGNWPAAAGQ